MDKLQRGNRHTRPHGLTLLELLMAIALIGILLSIGAPTFADLVARNRMAVAVNALIAHLQFTRSEAIKRGVPVQLCPSADGATCTGGQAWHLGYIVTTDEKDPAARLRVGGALDPNAIQIRSNRYRVIYQPLGTAGGSNQTFLFCDQRAAATVDDHRKVVLSNVGRPRVETPSGEDPCQG
ncbi:GspH/FimT family pseudopilin [Thiococcus pfennigii]|uniref:GspH/FimT family pseudopilin n=1 Tax=Thiococcus pfennigii TaxID=1057 RepID=UPI00190576EB|nr:GspH/FimT family pseudopilin [Thiococcus pfennigii]MBK1699940.1 hypothetical protein [Thiococcus pfennigii]MBK1730940.1 hypothetical protein [Thiococcus pfennigii]